MDQPSLSVLAHEIQRQALKLAEQLNNAATLDLVELRDDTANLQAQIAEATHLERLGRRGQKRGAAMLTPVVIESQNFAGFCAVENLTVEGMRGRAYGYLPPGQKVRLRFASDQTVTGHLVWSAADRFDVDFDSPINFTKCLKVRGEKGALRRAARLRVCSDVEVFVGNNRFRGETLDISQHGIKIAAPPVDVGTSVVLSAGYAQLGHAKARWNHAGTVGLSFERPLRFEELAHWTS